MPALAQAALSPAERRMLDRFVAEGETPDDLARPLQNAHELRVAVDDDAQRVSEEKARELLAHAERLGAAVEEAFGDR